MNRLYESGSDKTARSGQRTTGAARLKSPSGRYRLGRADLALRRKAEIAGRRGRRFVGAPRSQNAATNAHPSNAIVTTAAH
ncbi:MAG: hypothetical protein WBP81_32110 [Solirubrobacteraceae bacterium]